ncbi:antitoxin Xre/MbcA/ParS toxin-binding domain-containing protein [Luteitalea sp.]|jgi:putative toxin-antitoxin system antitoxin component (TIGR02293 family)|uniref:antitoxin Xre/MbcA/ParS toxin-binding domain-containing protein n=1 Tax=Luteitalea sp. TaxID=2004800 RepID=UPI0037C8030B
MPRSSLVVRERPPRDDLRLADIVVSGTLPLSVLDELLEAGFSATEIGDLVINPRTLRHRRARGEALAMEEAERAVRLARMLATAEAVLGGRAVAWAWLREPNLSLNRARPLDLLKSEIGARAVEETLVRLEHGLFA